MKAKMFHFQTKLGRLFGAYSLFTTVSSWIKQVSFLNETLSLDLLLKSLSPRTPRLIMPYMLMPLHTQRTTTTTSFMECFGLTQVCIFNSGILQGIILDVNLPIGVCYQNHFSNTVKAWIWHSQNPLRKTHWVLILPSLQSVFVTIK